MASNGSYDLSLADAYLLDEWDEKSEQDPNTQRETLFRAYSEMEMEARLTYMSSKVTYLEKVFPQDPDRRQKCEQIVLSVRKSRIELGNLSPNTLVIYRTWNHPDSNASYEELQSLLATSDTPVAIVSPSLAQPQPQTEETAWQTIFTLLPELLDLPLWDAIHYIRCANEASKSAARLEGVMDRILQNSGLWEEAPEGKSEFFAQGTALAVWLNWMEPFHRAYVVGNVVVFDEETASSGKLRFIWFDDRGRAVRETRVPLEYAKQLARFKYGETLKNSEFVSFWCDPVNGMKVGPDYVFDAA